MACPHPPSSQGASLQRRPRRRCHLPPELRPCGGARARLRPSPGAGSATLGPAQWTARPGGPLAAQGGRMGARSTTGPSLSLLGTPARAPVSPFQPPHCLLTGRRPRFKPHGCRSKRSFSSSASCACSPVFRTGRRPPTLFRPSAPCLLEAPQVGLLPGLPRSPSSHSPAPSSTWCPVLLGPPSVALPSQLSSCRYRGFCGAFLVGFWEVVTPGRLGAGGLAQKM